jgi:hypothetical protein
MAQRSRMTFSCLLRVSAACRTSVSDIANSLLYRINSLFPVPFLTIAFPRAPSSSPNVLRLSSLAYAATAAHSLLRWSRHDDFGL